MKCFHHNDLDGIVAAALVHRLSNEPSCPSDFISIDYKDDVPFAVIAPGELVYIVDFSLQQEGDFDKLLSITKNIVWIDHHMTAIEKHAVHSALPGIRLSDFCGIELTYFYFKYREMGFKHTDKSLFQELKEFEFPLNVSLVGDWDTFRWRKKGNGDIVKPFVLGLGLEDLSPCSDFWNYFFGTDRSTFVRERAITNGLIIQRYLAKHSRAFLNIWGYESEWEGYHCIVVNSPRASSEFFGDLADKCDVMLSTVFNGHLWTVTLYTNKPNINVGELAAKYGGGGHHNAAGFNCSELPFKFSKRVICSSSVPVG